MSTQKPSKYRHNRFTWHEDDMDPDCIRKVLKCKLGYRGHLTSQLNQNVQRMVNKELELQVIKKVAHSHFTHETDLCRHLACEIGRTWIAAKLCRRLWGLNKRTLPAWVRRDLYGE